MGLGGKERDFRSWTYSIYLRTRLQKSVLSGCNLSLISFFHPLPTTSKYSTNMDPPCTRPMPDHQPGYEILTKHKEAIRQLHKFAKIGLQQLQGYYSLAESTVRKILRYDVPERARLTRTGRPRESLNTQEV